MTPRVAHPPRPCSRCGALFTPRRADAVYCGCRCRVAAHRASGRVTALGLSSRERAGNGCNGCRASLPASERERALERDRVARAIVAARDARTRERDRLLFEAAA